jgi:hypothetical protein
MKQENYGKNLFGPETLKEVLMRIDKLNPSAKNG